VVGDILSDGAHLEQRRAAKVLHRDDHVADMRGVLGNEAISPIVDTSAVLSRSGGGFGASADRVEPEVGAADQNGRHLGVIGRGDLSVRSRVGAVYPVVYREPRVGDSCFLVDPREAGVEDFPGVGDAVTVVVLHIDNVGCAGYDQAAFPGHDAADCEDIVGEDGHPVRFAVAVRVFEQADTGARGLARGRVIRIVHHLGHVDTAVLVEHHLDGTHHLRLGSEQLYVKVLAQAHGFERIRGG